MPTGFACRRVKQKLVPGLRDADSCEYVSWFLFPEFGSRRASANYALRTRAQLHLSAKQVNYFH